MRAFVNAFAELRAMVAAEAVSQPDVLLQAWICAHHAHRARVPCAELQRAIRRLPATDRAFVRTGRALVLDVVAEGYRAADWQQTRFTT